MTNELNDERMYGKSSNPEKVKVALEKADAKWTSEGWIVSGDLYFYELKLTKLPLIREVDGGVDCSDNPLTSLEGAPQSVGGSFYCDSNQLTSLEGAPQLVGGSFYCHNNQLTSLDGCPQKVSGDFYCAYNRLTSLEGAPQLVGRDFYCHNNQLTSLEGAPQEVGGSFYCSNNPGPNGNGFTKEDIKAVCNVRNEDVNVV